MRNPSLYNKPSILSKSIYSRSIFAVIAFLTVFAADARWNDPYPAKEAGKNIVYSSFSERPKHLDPARSYSSDEYGFIAQIYEPPLQYHFLRRPYTLVPLSANGMPVVRFLDASGKILPDDTPAEAVAYTEYEIRIRPGIMYQPHPALARSQGGEYLYHDLSVQQVASLHELGDFTETGSRELRAEDFVYQIKRLADPQTHSPIGGVMSQYISGFRELTEAIKDRREKTGPGYLDLRQFELSGAEIVDEHTYRVRIQGKYPQFLYWQAMPFFAPLPWEADWFYGQAGLAERNITLDWYPIGTGPFMLAENNPNLRMVLARNPNFRGEPYPVSGERDDEIAGLLEDAGRHMPFIDKAIYSLEKESIPRWNKFLQGYYDNSGISSDSFDQAVQFTNQGDATLTDAMAERGIELSTSVQTSIYYMGFNMLQEIIGGDSERARKLRRAISIAVDFEEFISIFTNGRGVASQGPVPPGIFGHREGELGINPYVYDWADGRPRRKSIAVARELMREAGYDGGIDRRTGKPLVLHFEAVARGPDDKARLNWIRKQFDKLGIQLVVRSTDYNRFREKMLKGTGEIFFWGWNADYPDPENFLFLLYGPNSKATYNGENASNYSNPEFDRLFEQMKNMDNGPKRQELIDRMVDLARRDAPWLWGFHPKSFTLFHSWYRNVKPNLMANNTLKYKRVDPDMRHRLREEWNEPVLWPIGIVVALLALSVIPAVISFRRRERSTAL